METANDTAQKMIRPPTAKDKTITYSQTSGQKLRPRGKEEAVKTRQKEMGGKKIREAREVLRQNMLHIGNDDQRLG
jgi:hypothetical protein